MGAMNSSTIRKEILRAWIETLQIPTIGADDDFFALGGTSLLASRMVGSLRRSLDAAIPVRLVVEHSVFAEFADAVEDIVAAPKAAGASAGR